MAIKLKGILLANGNYAIVDDFTNMIVDDNSGDGFDESVLIEYIRLSAFALQDWCYNHGVRVDDFNYYEKYMYDEYMLKLEENKFGQKLDRDERIKRSHEAALRVRERQIEEQKALEREQAVQREMVRQAQIEAQAERDRQAELKRQAEENQRRMLEEEKRIKAVNRQWLSEHDRFLEFCKIVRKYDKGFNVLSRIISDHLRFYDVSSDIRAYVLANIVCFEDLGD